MYYRYLQARLKQLGISRDELSARLKVSSCCLSGRFTNRTPWTLPLMYQIMEIIRANPDDLAKYFPKGGVSDRIYTLSNEKEPVIDQLSTAQRLRGLDSFRIEDIRELRKALNISKEKLLEVLEEHI